MTIADDRTDVQTGGTARPRLEPGRLFIDGEWRESAAGGRADLPDASAGHVVTTVAEGDAADVDTAVAAARRAFDEGPWSRTSGRERARALLRVADGIRRRADEIAAVESIDVGKPITLSRAVDVDTVVEQYEYHAALAKTLDGAARPIPLPAHAYTRREAPGVVGAITPFDFPLILSNAKLAPALAAGNTIVHEPAEGTPLSALLMAGILAEAGVPAGVLNVVTGTGPVVDEAMLRHPGIDKIAFTGSTAVGRHAAAVAVAGETLKPVTPELGGNAAQIVFEDADVEKAIDSAIKGLVFNTGQFCMAAPRLLVQRGLYDTVVAILADAVAGVPVGDPFDPATVVGPTAVEEHLRKAEEYVAPARAEGGRVVVGGERIDAGGGYYHRPTVIADLSNDSRAVQEEIFGPVLTVQAFGTEEEAVSLANSTVYGLAAGLQTTKLAPAHRVAERLQVGIVWIDDWAMLDPAMPFGGVEQSGFGREYGPEALDPYTGTKSVVISLA